MKYYIITWLLILRVQANHGPNLVSRIQTTSELQTVTFHNRDAAIRLYDMKQKEYNAQFLDSTHYITPCPKCWAYIDSVKMDSIPIK